VRLWFSSDFGQGPYAGICRGVVKRLAPEVEVLDLTHDLPAFDPRGAALWLAEALPHLPPDVHLAVVDPGVGTPRRAVVLRTARGDLLVGPDNGLWSLAWERVGGVAGAWELAAPSWRASTVSATFQARDVFAPAAAHLARGEPPEAAGPAVAPAGLLRCVLPAPRLAPGRLEAEVLLFDPFGSAVLAARPGDARAAGLRQGMEVEVAAPPAAAGGRPRRARARCARTFADVPRGALCLLEDSSGWLLLAAREGSARAVLGLERGAWVTLVPAAGPAEGRSGAR
jgi:S-adenosylmethionine hydrolase